MDWMYDCPNQICNGGWCCYRCWQISRWVWGINRNTYKRSSPFLFFFLTKSKLTDCLTKWGISIPRLWWRHSEYLRYESLGIIGLLISRKRTGMPTTATTRQKYVERLPNLKKTKHVWCFLSPNCFCFFRERKQNTEILFFVFYFKWQGPG